MIALDTNVLVRYLTMDDPDQSERARRLVEAAAERGERLFVPSIVLCEVAWVLERSYRVPKDDLVDALSALLRAEQLEIEGADVAHRALHRFRSAAFGFADCLVLESAEKAGCERVATFDRRLLQDESCVEP